ncbi:hypothetical protein AEAC466_12400 [Asticcacaulis sp. AC466]|nr:hypothetical protein AEAC466_12400 [Asticcacaulis sp. AC466]
MARSNFRDMDMPPVCKVSENDRLYAIPNDKACGTSYLEAINDFDSE